MEIQKIADAKIFNEERFTKIDFIKTRNSMTFVLNFLPGQEMRPHDHPNRELYLHILEGSGLLSVDDKEMEVKNGDVVFFDSKEKIGFTNTSDVRVSIHGTMTKVGE